MKNSLDNIEFEYLYRDGGNYKIYQSVVFNNPDGFDIQWIEAKIKSKLIDGEFFYPTKWRLPFRTFGEGLNENSWAEFVSISSTREAPNIKMNISNFLQTII